ncbi:hypothetical protein [Flavihumibacter sp. CACIAM 22H1]|uniref:hypothetical protein n=1 Tax=Flavihumibacter sp. CACIAM 22H1 TaxID=1812911 RepID=UPI0007A8EEF2|nr:hypothetical protein [Flavihumibacter sp. CACIAM 22H1]KYP14056.1 MAG: hypothetical protein A1D16_08900 [Flavihumibacter sp. CACIAM 22H1]
MRKLTSFFVLGWMGIFSVSAQVSLSLQEPPAGIVQKNQLWNLALVNAGAGTLELSVVMTLMDISTNQPVLSGTTKTFFLPKGVKQIRLAEVGPINYTYTSPIFSRLNESLLPVGLYQACYYVYGGNKDGEGILAEDCVPVEVQPLSPPQLNFPADSAILSSKNILFAWLPPTPANLFADLNYDLLVTEIRSDQTPAAAIQENLPIYFGRQLKNISSNFPASGNKLDTAKWYAWQIIAKNGQTPAGFSETWIFKIQPDKPELPGRSGLLHVELGTGSNIPATVYIKGSVLAIKHYSFETDRVGEFRITDEKGGLVKSFKKKIAYGDNYIQFELDRKFQADTYYTIEFIDTHAIRYSASFVLEQN